MRIPKLSATLAVVLIAACGGDDGTGPSNDDDDNSNTGPVSVLSVSANGTTLTAGIISGNWAGGQFALSGIFGAGSSIRSLNISASNYPGPGTYQLGPGTSGVATWVDASGSYTTFGTGSSGTITLTIAQPGHIKGTFSFTATSPTVSGPTLSINVTNGTFEVKPQ